MENEGYIKLYRKILDNPIICKDSDYCAVWIYLLLSATHKELPVLFKGEKIILKSGQLITGRKIIAEKFGINESKIQRILNKLEKEHQIEQQTSTKNRLISILNWNKYQFDKHQIKQQVNNERTTSEQQVNTNKNDKNIKNDNNIKENIKRKIFVPPTLEQINKYIIEKQLLVNGQKFYEYFEEGCWKDSKGNQVKNWKQKLLTWNKYVTDNTKKQNYEQRKYDNLDFLYKNSNYKT